MSTPLRRKHLNLTAAWKYPTSGNIHAGYDYKTDIGTRLFAVRDGEILRVVDNISNMDPDEDGESGDPVNFILQEITYKGRPATFLYLHVSPNVLVKEGDKVEEGQQLGKTGHNGNSSGPHLHVALMKGQRSGPFDYLQGLTNASVQPKRGGVASNGITIFPPRVVFRGSGSHAPTPAMTRRIVLRDLTFGTLDSDSVRHLQHRLNRIPLEGGVELPVTGNYLEMTRDEVKKWQVQKRHHQPDGPLADGNIHPRQARILFGKNFDIVE